MVIYSLFLATKNIIIRLVGLANNHAHDLFVDQTVMFSFALAIKLIILRIIFFNYPTSQSIDRLIGQ
jgi:hypothetical protein